MAPTTTTVATTTVATTTMAPTTTTVPATTVPTTTAAPTTTGTPDASVFNGFRYFFSGGSVPSSPGSTGALTAGCESLEAGSTPVSILSAEEAEFVGTFVSSNTANEEVWVGGQVNGGELTWMDGSAADYDIFGSGSLSLQHPCVLLNNPASNADDAGEYRLKQCRAKR